MLVRARLDLRSLTFTAGLLAAATCATPATAPNPAPTPRQAEAIVPIAASTTGLAGAWLQDWVRLSFESDGTYRVGLDTEALAPEFSSGTWSIAGDTLALTDTKGPCAQADATRTGSYTFSLGKAGLLFKVNHDACEFRAGLAGEPWKREPTPAPSAAPPVASSAPLRVLFIGNSYTYVNDLPGMLIHLGAAGDHPIHAEAVLVPGATLQMHWDDGEGVAAKHLAAHPHDVVVLQEQSMRPVEDRAAFAKFAKLLGEKARATGARLVLFATWPRAKAPERAPDFAAAFATVARDLGATVASVGDAWAKARAADATLPLYSEDGSHPAPLGSYLAALTLYKAITGASPVGLPAKVLHRGAPVVDLSATPHLVKTLQQIAAAP